MKKGLNRGFTLIELLVVIGIIGIMSAVVLAALNSSRNRGADSAIKASLSGVRVQAELYYVTTFTGVCGDSVISAAMAEAVSRGGNGGNCYSASSSQWSAWAGLKGDATKAWCVDNTGVSRQVLKSNTSATLAACPAAG